jgi:hypothetical protein
MTFVFHANQDKIDRECGIEVAYVNASHHSSKVNCIWWYQKNDPRNGRKMLPGKTQTKNRGYLFALRELLKSFRKRMEKMYFDEQTCMLLVKTDASYVEEGVNMYRYRWRRSNWTNKRNKKIANSIFWQSVNNELTLLENMGISILVERHPIKFRLS